MTRYQNYLFLDRLINCGQGQQNQAFFIALFCGVFEPLLLLRASSQYLNIARSALATDYQPAPQNLHLAHSGYKIDQFWLAEWEGLQSHILMTGIQLGDG